MKEYIQEKIDETAKWIAFPVLVSFIAFLVITIGIGRKSLSPPVVSACNTAILVTEAVFFLYIVFDLSRTLKEFENRKDKRNLTRKKVMIVSEVINMIITLYAYSIAWHVDLAVKMNKLVPRSEQVRYLAKCSTPLLLSISIVSSLLYAELIYRYRSHNKILRNAVCGFFLAVILSLPYQFPHPYLITGLYLLVSIVLFSTMPEYKTD